MNSILLLLKLEVPQQSVHTSNQGRQSMQMCCHLFSRQLLGGSTVCCLQLHCITYGPYVIHGNGNPKRLPVHRFQSYQPPNLTGSPRGSCPYS